MGPARTEGSDAVIDDAAPGLLPAGERLDPSEPVHIATGSETLIRELGEHVQRIGFEGETVLEEWLRLTVDSSKASVTTAR